MRSLIVGALLAAAVPLSTAAQVPGRRPAPRMQVEAQNRRAMLERQILQRFVERSGREIGLAADARERLEQMLTRSNADRRELALRGFELRRQLFDAIGNASTGDDEFRSILAEMDRLREREHEIWRRDQEQLGRVLSPRQHAEFAVRWLRFQESIRGMIDDRRGGLRDTSEWDTDPERSGPRPVPPARSRPPGG